MLIATLMVLLFMGSGANFMLEDLDQLHDRIKAEIGDDVNRNAVLNSALDVADKMKDTAKDYADADTDDEKELLKLIQQYDSATADIQKNMDASYQKRVEYQEKMMAFRTQLKSKLGRNDWGKVFSADKKK